MDRHPEVRPAQAPCTRCRRVRAGTRIEFEVGVERPRSTTSREHRLGTYTERDRFRVLERRTSFLCHSCQRRLLLRGIVSGEGVSSLGLGAMVLTFLTISAVLGWLGFGETSHVFQWALLCAFGGSLLLYRHLKGDPRALAQLALAADRAELAKILGVKERALRARVLAEPAGPSR
jgi:hypothetical protein